MAEAKASKLRKLRARLVLLRERREKAVASLARAIRRAESRLEEARLVLSQHQEEKSRLESELAEAR